MITHRNLFVNTHFPVSRLPSHYDHRYPTYPLEVILKEIQSGNDAIPNTADHIRNKTLRGVRKEATQSSCPQESWFPSYISRRGTL